MKQFTANEGEPVYNKLAGHIAPLVPQSSIVEAECRYVNQKFRAFIIIYVHEDIAMSTCRMMSERIKEELTDLYTVRRIDFVVHGETFYVATFYDNMVEEYQNWEASHD